MAEREYLDLDQLFGEDKTISLKWGGKKYQMRPLQSLGPRELKEWARLYNMIPSLGEDPEDIANVDDEVLSGVVTGALEMICSEVLEDDPNMPFIAKVRAVEFYVDRSDIENAVEGGELAKKKLKD